MSKEKKSFWMEKQTGNFTLEGKDTFDPAKRYVGIRLQQGVPLLDRDWNELEDIRRYEEQMFRKLYIGNGTPDDGFRISAVDPAANDFMISAGRSMVDGFEAVNEDSSKDYIEKYSDQGLDNLKPPREESRMDTVYLDVWIKEVRSKPLEPNPDNMDVEVDSDLANANDVNEETCVRHKLVWCVRVDEGSQGKYENDNKSYHYYYKIAIIKREKGNNTISDEHIEDLREKRSFTKLNVDVNGTLQTSDLEIVNNNWAYLDIRSSNNDTDAVIRLFDENDFWSIHNNDVDGNKLDIRFNNSSKLKIDTDGNVGIGTDDPKEKLHVDGSIRGNQSGALRLETEYGYVDIGPKNMHWSHFETDMDKFYFNKKICVRTGKIESYNENLSLCTHGKTGGTARITVLKSNGNVGIGRTDPEYLLHMKGNAYCNGSEWIDASSIEYKKDVAPLTLDKALETLTGLSPVTFRYKEDAEDKRHVGFIAEEVPELVATKERKGLSSMDIVGILTRVVQHQQNEIKELKTFLNGSRKF